MEVFGRRLCARMECGLYSPKRDGVSHGRFDELSQRLALLQHRLQLSAQFWLDADLGDDGGFHEKSVLRLRYANNG